MHTCKHKVVIKKVDVINSFSRKYYIHIPHEDFNEVVRNYAAYHIRGLVHHCSISTSLAMEML